MFYYNTKTEVENRDMLFHSKTCSLNCVHNVDQPIKKNRVDYSLFFLP